ncbi:iron complex outermembrane receptor protein [Aquamicrobium lusatiense]|uniref:Iron complex outermembrane receptor protein n=1 Tax=Aquamicrobium lusatiense TaxID=89772 RepID=A0A7W9S4H3_9HYPH|nr:TonB-dependent siderophore receptor [Aquamicrobium lusatiense]MBB6013946.1 iron complex outermembrane receptor protein [Aquamicrobium lusatiense]
MYCLTARHSLGARTARLLLTTAFASSFAIGITTGPGMAQSRTAKPAAGEKTEKTPKKQQENEDGTINLDTVLIHGKGGKPPAYAGGQVATGSGVGLLGNKDVMDTPFSTVSYTSDHVKNREAQDIGAAIGATDPSVYVPSKRTIFETFYIRGFSSSADDVLFNGLAGMAPNMRGSTEFADRIEVLKGPSTFLYGMPPAGSVGGIVSLVPKRAEDTPLTRLTTSYSSDSLWGVHADIGRRFGENKEWGIRVNGVLRDGHTAVDDEKHGMKIGSVGLDWRGERARFSVDYYKQKEDMDGVNYFGLSLSPAVTQIPSARNGKHSLAAPWAFNSTETDAVVLRGEVDLTDSITAYAAVGRRSGGYDALITSQTLLNNAGDISVSATRQKTDGTQYSGEAGLRGNFALGGVTHEWNLSASGFKSRIEFETNAKRNFWNTNYNDLDFGPAPDLPLLPNGAIEQHLSSYAFSDTMKAFDDRLQVTVGARYQNVKREQFYLPNGQLASSYESSRLTPGIGIVYKATDSISLYANYIEGLSPGSTAPLNAANSGDILKPYKTTQYEVGAKWDMGSVTTSLALFQIEKPSAYIDPATQIYDVYGEQRNRGVELSVYGEIRSGLRLLGGIAYTDAKVTKSDKAETQGRHATGVPSVMAKLGLEYDVGTIEGLTLLGNISYTGKRYANNTNTLTVPDFTTLDLGARYTTRIGDNPLTLRAMVQNVTNESYWAGGDLSGGYGAPRTFLFSATMDF